MSSIEEDLAKLHRSAREGVSQALQPGETVRFVIPGERSQALVGTERRAFVFKKGVTSGAVFGKQLNSWDYQNLSGVELKKGMVSQAIVLQAPGVAPVTKTGQMDSGPNSAWEAPNAIMVSKKVDCDAPIAVLRQLIAECHRPVASSDSGVGDPVDQIKRLAELRDQGVVSDEEFQAAKKRLLGI